MFSANRSGGRSRIPNFDPIRNRSSSLSMYSRDSYGVNNRRASSEERKSNSAMRRFSGVRNSLSNDPKGVYKEMRPLADKAYQKRKIAELYEFLLQNDFMPSLTQSKLMQPSKKEYEMIFQFLVNFCEPSFEVKNLEEDAPRILKNLGYPNIPNKSVFMYVARTSFSSLLGVLLFLMDIAKYCLSIDLSFLLLTGDSERPNEHKVLMEYIFDRYPDKQDESMIQVFEKIVRSREGHSVSYLEQDRDLKKEKLLDLQKKLEDIEELLKAVEDLEGRKKTYEDYFLDLEKCKDKKEAAISKLTNEIDEIKTILHEQEEILRKKQALYDAQGFDGKKHLTHFEELKKDLNEALLQKKTFLRNIQEECWSLDIEHTKVLDKANEVCKDLVHIFSQLSDAIEANFNCLRNIKDPQVQNVCNNFQVEIPDCPADATQRAFMAWIDTHKELLDGVEKKIKTTSMVIKTIISAKSEELTMVEMKKLEISTKLKCSSSAEVQKEHDLAVSEKQAVQEVKVFKDKCDKDLAKLEELQNDKREKLDKLSKLQSDLKEVEKIKKSKLEMLEKYKEEQKKFFALLKYKIENAAKEFEKSGFEISEMLGELVKRYKRETE